MKSFTRASILIVVFILIVSTCADEPKFSPGNFDIEISQFEVSSWAEGKIIYSVVQGSAEFYKVKNAYIYKIPEEKNLYRLDYCFDSEDTLALYIQKFRSDINFHFPDYDQNNSIVLAVFNKDTLELVPSAIELEPDYEDENFTAILNLHSSSEGTFSGNVDDIPLVVLN
ncbi:MAG: hypothetical protein MI922_16305 [Bacteroidales bacterium]|nr:hypothetical protein [Bacteroidales bacterium]